MSIIAHVFRFLKYIFLSIYKNPLATKNLNFSMCTAFLYFNIILALEFINPMFIWEDIEKVKDIKCK